MLKPQLQACGSRESEDNTVVDLGLGSIVEMQYAKQLGLLDITHDLWKRCNKVSKRLENMSRIIHEKGGYTSAECDSMLLGIKDACRVCIVNATDVLDILLDIEAISVVEG